jgi:signal transduction histidine kinase
MQRLLGLLREEDDGGSLTPQPRVSQLAELTESVRSTGLDVELAVHGVPVQLEPAIDLSAYRIVQEALTNTLKHGRASHALVSVRYGTRSLELEISDDGEGSSSASAGGRGLLGMRERAEFFGGRLDHGARPEGGYRVSAWLPMEQAS